MKRIWGFFNSVGLTVSLAALICIDAAWGSILTMADPEFYRAIDQVVLLPWLFTEGLEHLSRTLWIFILILLTVLFTVNSVVCTAERVYAIVRLKSPWRTLAPHIVHIGFVIAVLGHLAGSTLGFRSNGNILIQGEPVPVPHAQGLFVRLDDMDIKTTPDGRLDELRTGVTLLRNDKEIVSGDIRMNAPLRYEGIAFYHVGQGGVPRGLRLDVGGEPVSVEFDGSFSLSDKSVFRLGTLYPDLAIDQQGRPYSRSKDYLNPHQEIIAADGQSALLDVTRPGTEVTLSNKRIILTDYLMGHYAVLNIHKDPGIWFIIVGSLVLVAGMAFLFATRGERSELVRPRRDASPQV